MTLHVPTLNCRPLVLRPPLRNDIANLAGILRADPTRYFGETLSFEASFNKINQAIANWVTARLGFWAMILEERAIGMLGFANGAMDAPELDIVIAHELENRGYATLALSLIHI